MSQNLLHQDIVLPETSPQDADQKPHDTSLLINNTTPATQQDNIDQTNDNYVDGELPKLDVLQQKQVIVRTTDHHGHNHDHNMSNDDNTHGTTHKCACPHSDVSDDEEDTEPGKSDPINEYDPDIDYIDLTNDRLQDIGDISKCCELLEIVLRQNKLQNNIFEQLNQCHKLERIDLYENRLTPVPKNTTILNNLQSLKELDLSFNELRFTRGLSNLSNLENLYLIQNKIQFITKDINNISDKLIILELGSNRIRCIENLDNFKQLEELYLGRNKIASIQQNSFQNLSKLRLLSLQSNRITKLEHLDCISTTLEELYMSHNGLKQIAGLKNCTNLRVLDLSNNFLTDIDTTQLEDMIYLEELWLNNNQIKSWDWIHKLTHLKNLKTIYLEHNPCAGNISIENPSGRSAYVLKIREILPQVKQIDAEYFD